MPLIGDEVILSENMDSIIQILPRKCEFVRPPVANIDQMVVVASLSSPSIDLSLIDALLISIEYKGIKAVVCINKIDLVNEKDCLEVAKIYEKAGYKTIVSSVIQEVGADPLYDVLKNKITAFAGNSGVGKSSLINLIDENLSLKTGGISKKIERGKHTTRHVELLPLIDGGFVVDTPGFSRMDLPQINSDKLKDLFIEFEDKEQNCKFRGCSHLSEPGCAVIEAVQNGEISLSRYESYKMFYDKLKDFKEWERV